MKAIRPHAALAAIVVLVCPAGAGPLDPPTGPVAATTGPTLIQFGTGPYIISTPGRYVMTKDHAVTGNPSIGGVPIQINVSGVELDLNGKTLTKINTALNGSVYTPTISSSALTRRFRATCRRRLFVPTGEL